MESDDPKTPETEDIPEQKEPKKKSKVGKLFSSVGSSIKAFGESAADKVKTAHDNRQEIKKNNKLFEDAAIKFTISSDKIENGDIADAVQFYAIKSMEDSSLLVRIGNKLTVNTVIGSCEGIFIITDVDSKTEIDFPTDGTSFCPIKCYKCRYKAYEPKSPASVTYAQTQNLTIQGDNHGDITQVAKQYPELAQIEEAINKSKLSLFQKKKKDEAIEMYGNFKNCIIKQQKDEGLFAKFLEVLKIVAPAVITLVNALISNIH